MDSLRRSLRLLLLLTTVLKLASGVQGGSQEAGVNCHGQCENGCYGAGAEECCHGECEGGCVGPAASNCTACRNVNVDGACQEDCGPPFFYNQVTFDLEPNPDFKFQHGHECVDKCPKFAFTEGTMCVERCSQGYREEGDQCSRCGAACPVKGVVNLLVNDQCDDVKMSQWGVLSRRNSPTGNVTCSQVLIGPHGSTLRLKVYDINIREDIGERLVLVGDGHRQTFDRHSYATVLTLRTSALVVKHRTFAPGNGYMLAYNFIPPENEVDQSSCDQVFTGNSGGFESPKYPGKYRARERCTYHIIVDPGYQISLVFNRFYLEGDEPDCNADKMEVMEPILGTSATYCGRHKPPFTITSQSNCLVLRFTSDDRRNFKGFAAVFTAVESGGSAEDFAADSEGDLPPPL